MCLVKQYALKFVLYNVFSGICGCVKFLAGISMRKYSIGFYLRRLFFAAEELVLLVIDCIYMMILYIASGTAK